MTQNWFPEYIFLINDLSCFSNFHELKQSAFHQLIKKRYFKELQKYVCVATNLLLQAKLNDILLTEIRYYSALPGAPHMKYSLDVSNLLGCTTLKCCSGSRLMIFSVQFIIIIFSSFESCFEYWKSISFHPSTDWKIAPLRICYISVSILVCCGSVVWDEKVKFTTTHSTCNTL